MMNESQAYNLAFNTLGQFQKDFNFNRSEMARVLTAIMFVESTYNPNAKNPHSTAKGLMQMTNPAKKDAERWLNLPTAPDSTMYNPQYNVKLGTRYFLYQWRRYDGNLKKSVIAYNQGSYNQSANGLVYWRKFEEAYKRISPVLAGPNYMQIALLLGVGIGTIYYLFRK